MLAGEGVHLDPAAILDGLTDTQAHTKPPGLPNSIADIVAHMCFWQEWFNTCLRSGFTGIPKHSVDGWPAAPAGGWNALRERYVRSIDEAKRIATETNSLTAALLPSDANIASLARESRGSALLRGAMHNSHHLRQIITMRRLMSLWPPPGGTITW
jgi:hypothetical protein